MTTLDEKPAGPSFWVEFTLREDVIALHGDLDIDSAPSLDAALDLLPDSIGELVLDLADLDFVGSVGLSHLVRLHRRLEAGGSRLVIRNPKPHVRRVFVITGLMSLFVVEP